MRASHINFVWSRLLIEELVRNGVKLICVAPGSRSSPLTLAAAENSNIETVVHFDERGASFYALGHARATGRPAAVICTSGTAVANCYAAVIEAGHSFTPLIVLSADRPPESQDTGALQTIDQVGIFNNFVRWSFSMPTPDQDISPSFLLSTVDQAYHCAVGPPAGAVHLNCRFREPLAPRDADTDWSDYLQPVKPWTESDRPLTSHTTVCGVDRDTARYIAEVVRESRRGVIVAGPLPPWCDNTSIIRLAERLEWPLIADINSGLRSGSSSQNLICHSDLYLRDSKLRDQLAPDFILQFGGTPISKHLLKYLARSGARWFVIQDHPFRQDPEHAVTDCIQTDQFGYAKALSEASQPNRSALLQLLKSADDVASNTLKTFVDSQCQEPLELAVAVEIFDRCRDRRGVYLATSMPIRDADAGAIQSGIMLPIAANRGVNGIDGTIAAAVGFASGLGLPVTLLTGDLALLHDLNSLALVRNSRQPITIVCINNNGGGVFSFLPIARTDKHFERYFGTPHGMSFEHVAAQFGLRHELVNRHADLGAVVDACYASSESSFIEVAGNRAQNVRQHQELWQNVSERLRIKFVSE